MAFTTASCKKLLDRCRLWLAVIGMLLATTASAVEVEVIDPRFQALDDGYAVSANFSFELSSRLEEAINRGVVLYFLVEFELTRPRWYWFDEALVARSQTVRLYYHALTRQYRVSFGNSGLHQSYTSLSEALRVLSRVREWMVLEKAAEKVQPGDAMVGRLRLRLDVSQLPKPFQIAAVGSRDWQLASDWKSWPIIIPTGEAK